MAAIGARPDATFADVAGLASGARGRANVLGEGKMEKGMWWAGQTQGSIHNVDTVENVVGTIISDAETAMLRLPTFLEPMDGVASSSGR